MSDTVVEMPMLWTEKRVAELLDISPAALRLDRSRGIGLPFVRLSPGRIRYRAADVEKYIAERTVVPRTIEQQRH